MKNIFIARPNWQTAFPHANAGALWMENVSNPESHPALELRKREVETELRNRFSQVSRPELEAGLPILKSYIDYYRQFKKTYHVLLQIESIAQKGKAIPRVAALVEAMFMAELEDMLLTAGHEAALLSSPVWIDVAAGNERYVTLSGKEQTLKPGDMYIADEDGILSSVVYGPAARSPISPSTRQVLYTVYAPAGVGVAAVHSHLERIESYVRLFSPGATARSIVIP